MLFTRCGLAADGFSGHGGDDEPGQAVARGLGRGDERGFPASPDLRAVQDTLFQELPATVRTPRVLRACVPVTGVNE